MALTTCPYCEGMVSNLAEFCPHCGKYLVEDSDEDLLEETDEKDYSEEIYSLFKQVLSEVDFDEDEEDGIITFKFDIDASIKYLITDIYVRNFDCYLECRYDNFRILSNNMSNISELLMRINDEVLYPQMILDYEEQDIVGRMYVERVNTEREAENAIDVIGVFMQKWANTILAVALGLQEPKEAFEKNTAD